MAIARTKTKLVIVLLVIIGLLTGLTIFLVSAKKEDSPPSQTTQQSAPEEDSSLKKPPTTDTSTTQPGSYVDYKEDVIETTSGTKILFFHAPWCPQCKKVEEDIKSTTLPNNVTIIKVDYDSRQDLRQKYGVTQQTTFVKVDDKGEKQDSFVAYSEPSFDAIKRELL